MNRSSFEKELVVAGGMVDYANRMKLSGMLREAQFIALEHCDAVGFTDSYMRSIHRVFLLTKLQVSIRRAPVFGERLRLKTTAYAPDRILYPRTASFIDESGAEIAEGYALWVLVDTERGRIVRKTTEFQDFPFTEAGKVRDISMPSGLAYQPIEPVRVKYSMIDQNMHMNNAVYADIAADAVGDELLSGREIGEFSIIYHREAKPGAKIELQLLASDTGAYVAGTLGGAACFEAEIKYRGRQ